MLGMYSDIAVVFLPQPNMQSTSMHSYQLMTSITISFCACIQSNCHSVLLSRQNHSRDFFLVVDHLLGIFSSSTAFSLLYMQVSFSFFTGSPSPILHPSPPSLPPLDIKCA
ncbi:hypothetical protein CSKR_200393 [Clonorchis sinensis]|uniref:Uncharacterized protein n=1 Tax=Clonorchis sinensis TaxID=79923 RepID=A0A8T1MCH4_CLOSI|nr:hypothetical protein CSKR_200393 [Clonorchis sinensis]